MNPDNPNAVIVVDKLIKKFGTRTVLDNVSLTAEKGQTTVIIGPSGCGKTVLMKHMIALEHPTEGGVYFQGKRIDELEGKDLVDVRMHFGFLFQGGALFDSLNVYENIIFPIKQHKKIKNWRAIDDLVKSKLAMVGMDGFQMHHPASLSGGQQKRVALARAIAMDPEVILYDEPTTGLDPIRSDIINELILKLQRELGVTSVVVTHDMRSAYKIADKIIMLHKGKILAEGDADYIKQHPHPVVQQFITGTVSEADLEALKLGGTKYPTQYDREDFQ